MSQISGYHKNTNQYEAEVFSYHRLTLLKQKPGKNICVHGKITYISKYSEAVAQPRICLGGAVIDIVSH